MCHLARKDEAPIRLILTFVCVCVCVCVRTRVCTEADLAGALGDSEHTPGRQPHRGALLPLPPIRRALCGQGLGLPSTAPGHSGVCVCQFVNVLTYFK